MKAFLLITSIFLFTRLLISEEITVTELSSAERDAISVISISKAKREKIKEEEAPWFSGTYLAFYAENVEPHKVLFDPSVLITYSPGSYDAHSHLQRNRNIHGYAMQLAIEAGITKKIDFTVDLSGGWAHVSEQTTFHFGDMHIFLGFQIATDKKGSWIPDFRVLPGFGFPTGKFENLDPKMGLADVTSSGAYETWLIFVTQKTFYNLCHPKHPYKWNLNLAAIHFSQSTVHGLSVYGGGPDVIGVATPGWRYFANLSYEYKFGKHWGWGIDIHYDHQNSSTFHTKSGIPIFVGAPSSESFSLAPEIEYNFNENLSIEAGVWYSLFGRNSFAFFTGFFAFTYQF